MQSNFDAVVSALSLRMFNVPPASVQEAIELSQASPDLSLLETLSELGHLRKEEKRLLEDLSEAIQRHETATESGYPVGAVDMGASPLGTLARFRDIADLEAGTKKLACDEQRYEVRHEHGRGGMGRILAVWDRRMQREVALKELLSGEAAGESRVIARFLREARITGRLQHPSIIPVHEIGVREDGTFYYTMKLVRGTTLRQAIKASPTLESRMALLPHFLGLCQAIAYAHAHGVIHRDIKPSNVMIGEFGETQVIDWGLAKEVGSAEAAGEPGKLDGAEEFSQELTMAGQLLGTPHYMAPEQAAGKHDELDERADVYALGAVLYELLTGSRPYQASTGLEVLRKSASEPPSPPDQLCPEAPPALIAVCRRAMEREPSGRYATAAELAEEIALYQAGARVRAYDYGTAELLGRFLRRHRPVVITVCLALGLLSGLGIYSYLSLRDRHAAEHDLRVASERKGYNLSILTAQSALEEDRYSEARQVLEACLPEYRGWEWGRLSLALDHIQSTSALGDGWLSSAEMSPDGQHLLTLGSEGALKLWSLPEMAHVRTYESGPSSWSASAFRSDGQEFSVHQTGLGVVRWRLSSPIPLATYPLETGDEGNAVVYSPDGRYLVAGAAGGAIYQWEINGGRLMRTLTSESKIVHSMAFSPDGRWLVSAGDSGRIQIWDWARGEVNHTLEAHLTNLQAGTQGALRVAFSPDGSLLASSGCDATAKLWSAGDWTLRNTLTGHKKKVVGVQFSPDSTLLATHSERGVKLWDTQTGMEQPNWIRCDQNIRRAVFQPDGRHLVTVEDLARATLWDLDAPESGAFLKGHTSEVNAVRFSPDGRYLASSAGHWLSGGDSRVLIWEMPAGGADNSEDPVRILEGEGRWINHLSFHPYVNLLSGADAECKYVTWDWTTGELVAELAVPEYTNGARCVDYSPDGSLMATAGWAESGPELNTVQLWDAVTQRRVRDLAGPTRIVDAIDFSPDGAWVAGGSRDEALYIWDVKTGALVRKLGGEDGWVYGVAFSPDGSLIAGSCNESPVMIWDTHTGELRHRLEGLRVRASKVAFNPEGTRVAACDEEMVKVWKLETGAALLTLPHGAQDVAFSPDGHILATAGLDGRVGIFEAAPWVE
jgi:WD40 repeat protein/serine/threonine protein kinase